MCAFKKAILYGSWIELSSSFLSNAPSPFSDITTGRLYLLVISLKAYLNPIGSIVQSQSVVFKYGLDGFLNNPGCPVTWPDPLIPVVLNVPYGVTPSIGLYSHTDVW